MFLQIHTNTNIINEVNKFSTITNNGNIKANAIDIPYGIKAANPILLIINGINSFENIKFIVLSIKVK